MRMFKFIKQLFCKHVWIYLKDYELSDRYTIITKFCPNCEKVVAVT